MLQGLLCFLMIYIVFILLCLLNCVIRQVGNYMDWTCFIIVNSCILWWLKLEPQNVSSSTLGIVSCTHVDPPSRSESLGGRSLLKLKRDSERMHGLSARQTKTKNHLSSRFEE
jgi:hypothetical protein